MDVIINFLLGYAILFIIWSAISLVFFALSYVFKKNLITILFGFVGILYFIVWVSALVWWVMLLINFFKDEQWLFLVLSIFFSSFIIGAYSALNHIILLPFTLLTAFLSEKVDAFISEPKGNVTRELKGIEADDKLENSPKDSKPARQLALWFTTSYFISLLWFFIDNANRKDWVFGDYVIMPFVGILVFCIPIAICVLIYNLIRRKPLMYKNKKIFFSIVLKVFTIIYSILLFIDLVYRV